jgi:hypothetical protein
MVEWTTKTWMLVFPCSTSVSITWTSILSNLKIQRQLVNKLWRKMFLPIITWSCRES